MTIAATVISTELEHRIKALRSEVGETVWSTLYRTQNQPFDKPSTGNFAVKVINHYGDEVLKVYTV